MHVNTKVVPVEITPGTRGRRMKENDGGSEF
jgi:hypothetical protein